MLYFLKHAVFADWAHRIDCAGDKFIAVAMATVRCWLLLLLLTMTDTLVMSSPAGKYYSIFDAFNHW